jgi:hypothetical protein
VTTQNPCSDRPGATRADIELLLKQSSQAQLEAKLRAIQRRLGSPDERPGDIDCAQLIVHQLNNILTVQRANELLRQLDGMENPPG